MPRLPASGGRYGRMARRVYPLALEAWRRWERLTPEEKERYRRMVGQAADRGRYAVEQARKRRGPGRGF